MQKQVRLVAQQKRDELKKTAEQKRQDWLNFQYVSKKFPDVEEITFQGVSVYVSYSVNTKNFKGIEYSMQKNSEFSQATVSARLYMTVKRPNRPAIRVYSATLYGMTCQHLLQLVNEMPPKSVVNKMLALFRACETRSRNS